MPGRLPVLVSAALAERFEGRAMGGDLGAVMPLDPPPVLPFDYIATGLVMTAHEEVAVQQL